MKSNNNIKVSVGVSSIIMIFVVLCLTTFGVLSYLSAQSDYKLTIKTLNSIKDYYVADSTAEEFLAEIDDYLYNAQGSTYQYNEQQDFNNLSVGKVTDAIKTQILNIYADQKLSKNEKIEKTYKCFVKMIITRYKDIKVTKTDENEENIFYITQVSDTYQIQTNLLINNINDKNVDRYNIISRKLVSTKQWEEQDVVVWGS